MNVDKVYYAAVDKNTGIINTIIYNKDAFSDDLGDIYKVNNYNDYIFSVSSYKIEKDGTLTFVNEGEIYNSYIERENRNIRSRCLPAFDLWEKAVIRGREEDSPEIMQWYKDILDLKPEAFKDENIPDRIKYYLGGN